MSRKIWRKIKSNFISCKGNDYQPRVLKSDFLFCLVFTLLFLRLMVLPFYVYFPKSVFFSRVVSSNLISLLNQQRESFGLNSLRENARLIKAAELKAQDMLEYDYFGHKNPDGIQAWYWIEEMGYDYEIAGENLAMGFIDSEEVHQAWNDSLLHKENLLRADFQDIGIAVVQGVLRGQETTIVVQLFGSVEKEPEEKPEQPSPEQVENLTEEEKTSEHFTYGFLKKQGQGKEKVAAETIKTEEIDVSKENGSLPVSFLGSLIDEYDKALQQVIISFGFLLVSILMLNIAIIIFSPFLTGSKINPRLIIIKKLIPSTALAIAFLSLLTLIDKSLIIKLLPHNLKI